MSKAPQPLRVEDRSKVPKEERIKLPEAASKERIAQGLEIGLKGGNDEASSDQWDEQAQKPLVDELAARPVTQREPSSRPRQEKEQRHSPLREEVEKVHPAGSKSVDCRCTRHHAARLPGSAHRLIQQIEHIATMDEKHCQ